MELAVFIPLPIHYRVNILILPSLLHLTPSRRHDFFALSPEFTNPLTDLPQQSDSHGPYPQSNAYDGYTDPNPVQPQPSVDSEVAAANYSAESNGFNQSIFQPAVSHQIVSKTLCLRHMHNC